MRRIGNRYRDDHACEVPLVRVDWGGITRPVHEGIVDQLRGVIADWEAKGGHDWYPIRQWWGYARRQCAGDSWHEVALAVDVNPAENPYVSKRDPCPSDMPREFVDLFRSRGFGWGGAWNSVCDAMHMSKGPNEGGDGRIYVTEEEDEDMPLTEDDLEKIENRMRAVVADDAPEIVRSAVARGIALWPSTEVLGTLSEGDEGRWTLVDGTHLWLTAVERAEVTVHRSTLKGDNGSPMGITVRTLEPQDLAAVEAPHLVVGVRCDSGGPVAVQAFPRGRV